MDAHDRFPKPAFGSIYSDLGEMVLSLRPHLYLISTAIPPSQ